MYHKKRRCVRRKVQSHPPDQEEESEDDDSSDSIWNDKEDVFFHTSVTKASILKLITNLREAEKHALLTNCHIRLFIHSEGGDAYAGLSGMNHIENMRVSVVTIADGFVASAATFLLLAGQYRLGMEHCTILIHQLSTVFWGKYAEMIDEMENSHDLMRIIRKLYKKKTMMQQEDLAEIMLKEKNISCKKCIKLGILHAVYDKKTMYGQVGH